MEGAEYIVHACESSAKALFIVGAKQTHKAYKNYCGRIIVERKYIAHKLFILRTFQKIIIVLVN